MKYDFIEIGTCDYDTLLDSCNSDSIGILVEPVSYYLNNLPNISNVIKLNAAISNIDTITEVYWVSPDDIIKYNLPKWVRGCNSIFNPHPTVSKLLDDKNINKIYNRTIVNVLSVNTLIKTFNITHISLLKIDTEGMDCIILNEIINNSIFPNKIIFESNSLSNKKFEELVVIKLKKIGYFEIIIPTEMDNRIFQLTK